MYVAFIGIILPAIIQFRYQLKIHQMLLPEGCMNILYRDERGSSVGTALPISDRHVWFEF